MACLAVLPASKWPQDLVVCMDRAFKKKGLFVGLEEESVQRDYGAKALSTPL
jgi:hypothetical protein